MLDVCSNLRISRGFLRGPQSSPAEEKMEGGVSGALHEGLLEEIRESMKAGGLELLTSQAGSVEEAAKNGDRKAIRFIAEMMTKGSEARSCFRMQAVWSTAIENLPDLDAGKLLSNVVVGSPSICVEAWDEAFRRKVVVPSLRAANGPLLSFLNVCIMNEKSLAKQLSNDREVLTEILDMVRQNEEEEDSEPVSWAMIIFGRLAKSSMIPDCLNTMREDEKSREELLDVFADLVDTETMALRITLSDADVNSIESLAREGSSGAINCLGSAASLKHPIKNGLEVAVAALNVSVHKQISYARSSALRLLAFLLSESDRCRQDEALTLGAIPLILSSMSVNSTDPLSREWAVLCVRFLCENNEKIQQEIASYELLEAQQSEVLQAAGLETYLTEDRKVKVRQRPQP